MRKIYLFFVSVVMVTIANAQVDVSSKGRTNIVSNPTPKSASGDLNAASSSDYKAKPDLPSGIDPKKISGSPKTDTTVPSQPVYKPDGIHSADVKIAIVDDMMFEKKKERNAGNNDPFNNDGGISPNVISATTYAFTSGAGTLEDMSSGTTLLVAADQDDAASAVTPVGFDFWFDGVRYTLFSVNANGLIRLGVAASTTTFDNSLDFNTATSSPKICPYYDDLWIGNNGKVTFKVIGSAPSRKLVIEWNNEQIPRVATATAGAGTFQAWLYESSGKIEFVYGSGIAANATNGGYTVGFATGAGNFASVTTAGATVSYAVANNTNTGAISSGTKYTFTPNTPADPTTLSFTAVGLNTMTLNWADNASNEFGYAIFRSVDGTNYDYIRLTAANATSSVETGIASNTTWFWRVYAVTEGALSNVLSGSQATTTGTLSGTRTIGPSLANYTSIGAAVTDINTNGLAGSLILELQSTYLSTVETFPLVVNTLGSPSNTITIRPITGASGLSITSANATATLDLNAATNVIIDGRAGGAGASQLTIANTVTTGVAIRLINDACRNTVQYSTVQGVNTSTTQGVIFFSTTTGVTGNNQNTISNCDVRDGATTPVNGITSVGTSATATLNTGNTITNCNVSNFYSATLATRGILVTTNTNLSNTGWTITNNRIFQTVSRNYTTANTHIGIFVTGGNDYNVSGNTVGFATSGGTGTYTMTSTAVATAFTGIQVQPGDGVNNIQGNTVAGISLGTTTGTLAGISVPIGSANIGTITGNTVGSATGNGSLTSTPTGAAFILGINVSGTAAGTINVSNNIVGSLTATGSPATVNPNINVIQILGGLVSFTNNLLGSTITANSIQTTTAGTSATAQQLIGMLTGTTMPLTISGNTLANITNFGTGTAHVVRGIQFQAPGVSATASPGIATISLNTIHDITGANANTTVAGGGTGVEGIIYTGTSPYGATVSQNTIYTISNTNAGAVSTSVAGIGYSNPSNGTVTKNKIYDLRNASTGTSATAPPMAMGILIRAALGAGATFANNMISLGNAQTTNTQFVGMMNSFNTVNNTIHYNSVHIEGTAAAGALPSYCFLRGDNGAASAITTPVDIKNNIFNNTRTGGTGKHYAIGNVNTVPATGWSATASNNNVLNSPVATTVGIWGLAADQTFATWKTSSGGDGSSLSGVSVVFVSTSTGDLHVNFGLTPTQLESGGVIVATTVDYDNQTRPGPPGSINGGGTLPDIGADEFDGVPQDITGPNIVYTPLAFTCNGAINRTLVATITDASGVPTAGAGLPVLYWRINAGPWNAATATWGGGSSYSFSFGAGAVVTDVVQYYIVAQDNVVFPSPNVSASPSGGAGGFTFSPPAASIPPTTPSSYTISTTLSGTYTVGTSGVYPTLTAAVAAYNSSCLSGAVIFELLDISYTTAPTGAGETYPITINTNPDASATNTLTIRPASGVTATITGSVASAAILRVLGRYVIIDGSNNGSTSRDLTITNTNLTTPSVVLIGSTGVTPVINNTLKNCIIINGINSSSAVVVSDAATLGNPGYFNNITLQNNNVQNAFIGIYTNAALAGGNGSGLNITTNDLTTSGANAIRFIGIYVQGADGATVQRNIIGNFSGTDAEDDKGIWFATGTVNSTATRNTISNLNYTGTGGYGGQGIYVSTGLAAAGIQVTNNSIYNLSGDGWNYTTIPTDNTIGIVLTGTQGGVNVYFNSINLYGNTLNQTSAMSMGIYLGAGSAGNIRNNNIVNNLGLLGATGYGSVGVYAATSNAQFTAINYNDYYVNPTGTGVKFLGQIAAAGSGTLLAWQGATTQDGASLNVDPLYVSSSNLALQAGSPSISAGVTIAGITVDFTGSTRNSPPSIGAYESKVVYSAKVFLQGAYAGGGFHKNVSATWAAVLNANALGQPYNTAAFGNYAGTESVTAGFFVSTGATTDVLDWVLVELRDAVTPSTIITRRAAFIREDGMIVDLDGVSPVSFRGFTAGSYFVAIRHRNHMGTRTKFTQLVDGSAAAPTPFDFSASPQTFVYQDGAISTNAAQVDMGGGVFGMWGGNANPVLTSAATVRASGGPTINDYLYLINTALGGDVTLIVPNVYSTADMNMDGTVRASGGPAINDYLFLINTVLSSSVLTIINQHL